ncbi:hypothetical protein ACFYKX_11190 [Cytobacillus sp. FJAT-54145]|uniref:Uncharacterized protein n=1 Tax=Cytobacillus spartinae TaxID=3299023 RepID=A0ABW6KAB5_9BACI
MSKEPLKDESHPIFQRIETLFHYIGLILGIMLVVVAIVTMVMTSDYKYQHFVLIGVSIVFVFHLWVTLPRDVRLSTRLEKKKRKNEA